MSGVKAICCGHSFLCTDVRDTHIRIRSGNTTTVAYIDRRCSKVVVLLSLVEQIFSGRSHGAIVCQLNTLRARVML